MKSNAEFLSAVLAKYEKRRIERRRRTVFLSGTVSVLVLAAVLGMGRFWVSRDGASVKQPVAPSQSDIQPSAPRIVTASRDEYTAGQMEEGVMQLGELHLDSVLKRAMNDPENEGALFRIIVYVTHWSTCCEEFSNMDLEDHLYTVIQDKVNLLNAEGVSSEIARNITYGFYVTGTKQQIELISAESPNMGYYARLALPKRPEGYSEVYSNELAACLEMADDDDVFEVFITSAWDSVSNSDVYTRELFNAGRLDKVCQKELLHCGKMKEALLAIGERYNAEVLNVHVFFFDSGIVQLEERREYTEEEHLIATLHCVITKEQLLKMSDDPEIRYIDVPPIIESSV